MNWKFHLKYNLILGIVASIPISAAILWSRDLLTIPQLISDTVVASLISFVVGAFFPFEWIHRIVKRYVSLTPKQFQLVSTLYICMVISGSVTFYFKWLFYAGTTAFWPNFWRDYPVSWLIAVIVSLWSHPYIVAFINHDTVTSRPKSKKAD